MAVKIARNINDEPSDYDDLFFLSDKLRAIKNTEVIVTAQAEKRSVIKGEMTVGGKWADIRRGDFHVNERLTSA